MAQVILSAHLQREFDRILDFMFEHAPDTALDRIEWIVAALDVLQASPLIGRPVENGKRELVIATGTRGFVALYQYLPELDTVLVLGVRSQRELRPGASP